MGGADGDAEFKVRNFLKAFLDEDMRHEMMNVIV